MFRQYEIESKVVRKMHLNLSVREQNSFEVLSLIRSVSIVVADDDALRELIYKRETFFLVKDNVEVHLVYVILKSLRREKNITDLLVAVKREISSNVFWSLIKNQAKSIYSFCFSSIVFWIRVKSDLSTFDIFVSIARRDVAIVVVW